MIGFIRLDQREWPIAAYNGIYMLACCTDVDQMGDSDMRIDITL